MLQAPPLLKRLNSIHDKSVFKLNSLPAFLYVSLGVLVSLTVVLSIVSRYQFDLTSMVRFGEYYALQNESRLPADSVVFVGNEEFGGNGYDGQIFYFFSSTLFEKGAWPNG